MVKRTKAEAEKMAIEKAATTLWRVESMEARTMTAVNVA